MSSKIHIEWEGPKILSDLNSLNDPKYDYGLYQIYGGHPIYGANTLLYIGKADKQTFGVRINQESWTVNRNAGNLQIYIGRLIGKKTPEAEQWSKEISLAEKLLIYSHKPAFNTQNLNSIPIDDIKDVHVFNWCQYCSLIPEVSGATWAITTELTKFIVYEDKKSMSQ